MPWRRDARRDEFHAYLGNRLCRPISVSITFRSVRAWRADLPVGKTEDAALFGPCQRQANSFQTRCCQFDRVPAFENRLDDARCEKGEWQDAADVSLMNAVTRSQFSNGRRSTGSKVVEPFGA